MGGAISLDVKVATEAFGYMDEKVSFNGTEQPTEIQDEGYRKITIPSLRRLLQEQGGKCAISGIDLTPDTCELDHIESVSNGGSNTMDNVQLLNSQINRMKGTMSNQEFIELAKKIATHNAGM